MFFGPITQSLNKPAAPKEEEEKKAVSIQNFLNKYTVNLDQETYKLKDDISEIYSKENIGNYFRDGLRKIDFVFAFEIEKLKSPVEWAYISEYIRQLEYMGLQFELEIGWVTPMIFVKAYMPLDVLKLTANVYQMELNNPGRPYLKQKNIITCANPPLKQYKDKMFGSYEGAMSSERIILVRILMNSVKFGKFEVYSLNRMLDEGYFRAAYPLHDSDYKWTEGGPYSSRQVLFKYWSRLECWCTYQPLDLIKQYYGTQVAFYWAWFGFYNEMLLFPSIAGLCVMLYGVIQMVFSYDTVLDEICNSNKTLCPKCFSPACNTQSMNSVCATARLSFLNDNYSTIVYAVLTTIWALIFMDKWKRQQAIYRLKWNAEERDARQETRPDYKRKTKFRRISPVTGKYEPYVPFKIKAQNLFVSAFLCALLVSVLIAIAWGSAIVVVYTKDAVSESVTDVFQEYTSTIIVFAVSSLRVMFMWIFKQVCNFTALWLTEMENPKTEGEYNIGVMRKMYILNFFNVYTILFFLTFGVGYFELRSTEIHSTNILLRKQCDPYGCVTPLTIQLLCLFMIKSLMANILLVIKV